MNNTHHSLSLDSRSVLRVTAVNEVLNFDESLVCLAVGESNLNVSGEDLSITNLSLETGEVTVTGRISALVYFDDSPKRKRFSLFGRGQ